MARLKILTLVLVVGAVIVTGLLLLPQFKEKFFSLNKDATSATNKATPTPSASTDDAPKNESGEPAQDQSGGALEENLNDEEGITQDNPSSYRIKKSIHGNPKSTKTRQDNLTSIQEKDIQDDFDWVNRAPDPNISIKSTVLSVNRYRQALELFKAGKSTRSIELIYYMGKKASQDLTYAVEHMESATYNDVVSKMEGFNLDLTGVFQVNPDYAYFEKLAQENGGASDQVFFKTAAELTASGIPNYHHQITELLTCTNYGEGLVVNAYKRWSEYKRLNPNSYVNEVDHKITGATEELTTNTCLCGSQKSLYKEYGQFIAVFPKAELSREIQNRMTAIKKGTLKVREECQTPPP